MDIEKLKESADKVRLAIESENGLIDLLAESVIRYLNACVLLVQKVPDDDLSFQKSMEFQWSQNAKEVAILLRDILFRIYRDRQFHSDNLIELEQIILRNKESQEIFAKANNELIASYQKLKNKTEKEISENTKWKHYNSPVKIFNDQMTILIDQIKLIRETQILLDADREFVFQLEEINKENQEKLKSDIASLRSSVQSVKDVILSIENLEDTNNITSAKSVIKKSLEKIEEIKISYAVEKNPNENFKSKKIPIGVNSGELIVKEISLLSQITSWIDNNIYPSIYEAQRSMVLICDNIIVALVNVQNRLELSTSENSDLNAFLGTSILEPLNAIGINPEVLYQEIQSSIGYVNKKFIENIAISNVFDNEAFLFKDQSISSISQIKVSAPKWVSSLPFKRLNELYTKTYKQYISPSITTESSISAIDFIDKKIIKSLDQYNHSLFLNKGFLGKSFIIERPNINLPIMNNYKLWLEGFRGSFLVYGSRLSGKSSILKSVFHTENEIDVIKLKPNKLITFQGRKHETGNDLGESLAFIDKYIYNKKVILIIDDIEIWRDKSISLYDNIKSLLEFMGKAYKRFFFLVSTNQWAKDQLDLYFNFSSQFVSNSSCNRMNPKEIQRALLIRHGATISELVYQDEQQDKLYLQKQTLRIASSSRENIGQSLLNWCRFSFHKYNIDEDYFEIPDKLVSIIKENREIFLFLLRSAYTNELELSNSVGSRFVKEFASDIQKLISYKLLSRNTDGNIEINEYIVSDVEAIMKYTTNKVSVYA